MEAVTETLLYTKPTYIFPLTVVKLTLFHSRSQKCQLAASMLDSLFLRTFLII